MKRTIIALALSLSCFAAMAQENTATRPSQQKEIMAEDYQIVKDEIVDGVRYVTAIPSQKVCSRQIDIVISDGIVRSVTCTRGCEGNAKGIGALIKGMPVNEAISRLEGITCGKRGTSCPDQLARVLKALGY